MALGDGGVRRPTSLWWSRPHDVFCARPWHCPAEVRQHHRASRPPLTQGGHACSAAPMPLAAPQPPGTSTQTRDVVRRCHGPATMPHGRYPPSPVSSEQERPPKTRSKLECSLDTPFGAKLIWYLRPGPNELGPEKRNAPNGRVRWTRHALDTGGQPERKTSSAGHTVWARGYRGALPRGSRWPWEGGGGGGRGTHGGAGGPTSDIISASDPMGLADFRPTRAPRSGGAGLLRHRPRIRSASHDRNPPFGGAVGCCRPAKMSARGLLLGLVRRALTCTCREGESACEAVARGPERGRCAAAAHRALFK